MKISDYLGEYASRMLKDAPFKDWPVEKSFENDLEQPIVHYVFKGHGLELRCDRDDRISVIFLYPDGFGSFVERLFGIPFSSRRAQVLNHYGSPSKTGEKTSDPVLGEFGAWDRFSSPTHQLHIEYRTNADAIAQITLMRNDVAP